MEDALFKGVLFVAILAILIVWSLVWKGIALWTAARKGEKWWFIVLLVINTIGILELLYIFVFSKTGVKKMETNTPATPAKQ